LEDRHACAAKVAAAIPVAPTSTSRLRISGAFRIKMR
jgi:hypothetical protein